MTFDSEPFNLLQFKASHNSYDRDENLHEQLSFRSSAPAEGGCRGLEFDVVRHSDASAGRSLGYFQVNHARGGHGPSLAPYLGYLLSFHAHAVAHDPIFVSLDIKSEAGDFHVFPAEIDAYLEEWFDPSLIYRPIQLVRDRRLNLADNVARYGWPKLADLRGKFCFCLSGTEPWKAHYASASPFNRLCFADFDVDDDDARAGAPKDGKRVIANLNLFTGHSAVWRQSVARFRAANMIVRGYVLNGPGLWQRALADGVNVLATDYVRGSSWALVGSDPYRMG